MVGTLLGDGWHMVGLWLVIVGAMLGDSWLLVGFWLAVIVGPTFIQRAKLRWPTKYVAVEPTLGLSQRLGFGWQMVSVLAGKDRFPPAARMATGVFSRKHTTIHILGP